MIKEFLKIAGVKNEKQFYNKYPSEAAFFKAHPEAKHLKSMKKGGEMKKLEQLTDFGNPPIAKDGEEVPKYQVAPAPVPMNSSSINLTMGTRCPAGQQKNPFTGACEPKPTFGGTGTPGLSFNPNQQGFIRNPTTGKYEQPQMFGGANAASSKTGLLDKLGGAEGIGQLAGGVFQAVQSGKSRKAKEEEALTAYKVAKVTGEAARSRSKDLVKHYYDDPHKKVITGEEMFPIYGVGSNVLDSAKDGAMIGGNPTEIQNMYNPGDLYSNLGYEPMSESDVVKQYEEGGYIPKAQFGGFENILGQAGNMLGGGDTSGMVSAVGNIAGKFIPGVGAMAQFAQGAINRERQKALNNLVGETQGILNTAAFESGAPAIAQATGAAKNGASINSDYEWLSHTWQPQVITKFGDVDVSQIHSIATEGMDTLRTGGRITQNNMYPEDMYALGGNLKTTWGGYAEPMSYNRHLPGTGEIAMFKGLNGKVGAHSQHAGNGHTGIGVVYGDGGELTDYAEFGSKNAPAKVEVEKGEPVVELEDTSPESMMSKFVSGGEQSGDNLSMNVFGDLTVSNQVSPKYAGRKYKHVVRDLGIDTEKINKQMASLRNKISNVDVTNPFGLIEAQTLKKIHDAKDNELKMIADDIKNLAIGQNATNETAEEYGIDANALAKGKIKPDKEAMAEQAKWGKAIKKAQTGTTTSGETVDQATADRLNDMFTKAKNEKDKAKKRQLTEAFQKEFHKYFPEKAKEIILKDKDVTRKGKDKMGIKSIEDLKKKDIKTILETNEDAIFGDRTEQYNAIAQSSVKKEPTKIPEDIPLIPSEGKKEDEVTTTVIPQTEAKKKPDWLAGLNTLLPYLQRPYESGQPNLYPEMMALSMNTLEPVKAQGVQPLLETPYDISLQDQLNEITAAERAAQKMSMGDPSALANIAAQSQAAKQKVLGEQFRMNQAMKAGVYGRNRQALNEAQLQNLEIFADQEAKQQLAKSKTKSTALEAMSSMSDKIEKRRAEERNIRLLENAFPNYRLQRNMQLTPSQLTLFDMGTTGVPAGATPPYVSSGRTASSAINKQIPASSSVYTSPQVSASPQADYQDLPTIEDLYSEETVYPEEGYGRTMRANTKQAAPPSNLKFTIGPNGMPIPVMDDNSKVPNLQDVFSKSFKTEKNGGITKKKHFNGSIVRALKNI